MPKHSVTRLAEQSANAVWAALLFGVTIGNCYRVVVVNRQPLAVSLGPLADEARPTLNK